MSDPKITLAGNEYVIPKLAIKQNRHIEPLVSKHGDYFIEVEKQKGNIKLLALTDDQAADFCTIIYWAISRARPEITLEQFEDMTISMREIMIALPLCLKQTGLFVDAVEAPPQTGEDQNPSTGIPS